MSELSQVRSALDDIKKLDGVLDASLVSRGGMFVMGGPSKGVHKETFAAMAAIMIGAAETVSSEAKDRLDKVIVELSEENLILIGVGTKYLVAVSTNKDADAEKTARQARDTISRLEIPV